MQAYQGILLHLWETPSSVLRYDPSGLSVVLARCAAVRRYLSECHLSFNRRLSKRGSNGISAEKANEGTVRP